MNQNIINNHNLQEKIDIVKSYVPYREGETMEIHVHLNINPKLADQMFVQKFSFPHPIGKKIKVLAFTLDESKKEELLKEGADYIADKENIEMIKKGKIFFDYCVASPDSMKLVSPLAKILGPKGLMPNVKLGTLDNNIVEAIRRLKQGQVSMKNDKFGVVHLAVGKSNQPTSYIIENIESLLAFVNSRRPQSVKGNYVKSIHISTTHGISLSI